MGGLPTGEMGRPPAGTRKAGGTHPTGMLSCRTASDENKMEAVTNTINFTVKYTFVVIF